MWSSWWNENLQGEIEVLERTRPSATLSTTNPTWLDMGSNPGHRGGKQAINRLSCVTPVIYIEEKNISIQSWREKLNTTFMFNKLIPHALRFSTQTEGTLCTHCRTCIFNNQHWTPEITPNSPEDSISRIFSIITKLCLVSHSAAGTATGYGLDGRGIGDRVRVGARFFSSPRRPDRL
jgi:hypothetical protein